MTSVASVASIQAVASSRCEPELRLVHGERFALAGIHARH